MQLHSTILQQINRQPLKSVNPFAFVKDRPSLASVCARENARRWFRDFVALYLPHHFTREFGEHHEDLLDVVQKESVNKRVVRCEPREHGKSTLMLLAAPLWWLARKDKWYVALFGSGGGAFWNHYSTLQNELDRNIGNQKLLDDYPHLAPLMDFKGQFVSWNDSRLKVTSGAIVEARTMGSHVRGMKEGKHRPDAMVFDDPQDEDSIGTDYQREKFNSRFRGTLVNLVGNPGDIYVIGNFLHTDSLVGKLLRERAWDAKLYRAENVPLDERDSMWPIGNTKTDGSALWPAHWPLERLHKRREEIGTRAYALEYMNRSMSDEEVVFDSTKFQKFHAPEFLEELDDSYNVIAFWDPSDPKDNRFSEADYAAIAVVASKVLTVGEISHTFHWVLHCWLNQARVELQCEEALRILQAYPVKKLYYEDNGGFGVLIPYLKRIARERSIALPLKRFEQTANKIQRVYNSEPIIKSRVFFADHLSTTYFTQWDEFPHGSHDDGPDATVSAVLAADRARKAFCI